MQLRSGKSTTQEGAELTELKEPTRPASPTSPGYQKKKRDLALSKEEAEVELLKDTWRSPCCGKTQNLSKAFLQFLMQAIISILIIGFCMFQLATKADPDNAAVYFSLISSMITLYVSPPVRTKPSSSR